MNFTELDKKSPPHIHIARSAPRVMADVLIALLPLYGMAYFYYGWRAVVSGALSAAVCLVSSWICSLISQKKVTFSDLTPLVTGLIIPLALPASVPTGMIIVAGIFAIVIVKYPFGGSGCNFFNPAAAGIAFTVFCWPSQAFHYVEPFTKLPVFAPVKDFVYSPAYYLKTGSVQSLDSTDLLLGNFAGPMGATCVLVLIACFLYLLIRRVANWRTAISFFVGALLMFLLFPRSHADNALILELCSGSLVFGGVFLVSEPVTAPKRNIAKMIYGFFIGVTTVLFRYYGGFEQGIMFAVLLANIFSPLLDRGSEKLINYIRRGGIVRNK